MNTVQVYSLLSDLDIHLFREGKHAELYKKLGAHIIDDKKQKGVYFAVWAPNAKSVNVVGSFNGWNKHEHQLNVRWDSSGIWEGFIPDLKKGDTYKYSIETQNGGFIEKGDPFAKLWEVPPKTASVIWDEEYHWEDAKWMKGRHKNNALNQPYSVYEVHLGSWRRKLEKPDESLSYVDMADQLVNYVKDLNFTHVEFMPVMEHPFFGSWGYQIHGYFAPTSRFGTPGDFQYLVDRFHQEGIGVLVDWVPSHFPGDDHGLYRFDGTALYEHEDDKEGFHPDWESYIFNYGRNEVRSFLISSAHCWLDRFHLDGLRVDAVASMLYRDYSRKEGEWVPNIHGGRENLEAISFLKDLNLSVYDKFPDVQTIAEESTSFPGVSKPIYANGLGFGMKWMMGWMNDTLEYFKEDPLFRRYHHNKITFSLAYAFSENFMLPLSHDEVVHGKGALIERMPGDEWQKFANLRLLYSYMYTHPGTKLLFMGDEIGQTSEWKHDISLSWDLLQFDPHKGVQSLVRDLNKLYKDEPALYEKSFEQDGFEWIELNDHENSILSYIRKGNDAKNNLIVLCNFTPNAKENYQFGVSEKGKWKEVFNSDKKEYWGSGFTNDEVLETSKEGMHGRPYSISAKVPPLGITILKRA